MSQLDANVQITDENDAPSVATPIRDDATLQACRRLDWRFLLPEPRLGTVLLWGTKPSTLSQALERFAESVTMREAVLRELTSAGDGGFDLAVLQSPGKRCLTTVASLLKPGGCVYIELHRRLRQPLRSINLSECVLLLQRKGFQHIQCYWHQPDFERCLEILPLGNRQAMRYYFSKPAGDWGTWLKLRIAGLLFYSGLLINLVPCLSIVARQRA